MKKQKIALVYDAIYPFIKGGGERRFYEMGKRMSKMGYDVHWYGMKFWDGPDTYEHDGITLHGLCKARPLYTKSGKRSISQAIIFGISSFKLIFADFDIIDCCGFPYFSLFPARLAATLKRKPLYATWHEVWGKKYWKEYLGAAGIVGFLIERIASALPNQVIATSNHTAKLLKDELLAKNVVVVENGIDVEAIEQIAPAAEASDLIYVGRIMDFKNINMLLEAVEILKDENVKLRCTILGDGPDKERLQTLAAKLKIDKLITWIPFLENSAEVYAHMKASKLFVLPSRREGFGIVVIEANACETAVLTADYATNAAKNLIIPGKNGYVFQPNASDLASTIKNSLGDTQELGKTARQVAYGYDWGPLTDKLVGVYES